MNSPRLENDTKHPGEVTTPSRPAEGRLHLLGKARWVEAQIEMYLAHGPTLWLLTYLAAHDGWVERAEIAELLWPDIDAQDSRNNLRQLLHRAKTSPKPRRGSRISRRQRKPCGSTPTPTCAAFDAR